MEVCQNSQCSTPFSSTLKHLQPDNKALTTATVAITGPIDPYRFNMFMSDLLAERGNDIRQMHGILSVQGYGNQATHFKFEGVQKTVRFGPAFGSASDGTHQCVSQVTFSGHNLSAEDLQEALDSCAWLPVAPGWTEHFAPGLNQPFYVHQATGRKQWQRPAAVESQQAVSTSHAAPAAVTVVQQDVASQLDRPSAQATEVCRQATDPTADTAQQRPARSQARSAVSCPCDASGACTAVFEIRSRTDLQTAKQARDEDVTSKLADLDIREGCISLFDSASELEMRKTGYGKDLRKRKLTSAQQLRHRMQRAKSGLRRSHSCRWIKAS